MFRYLPEPASAIAPKIDWVNNLITDLSVFFTAAIVGTMLYFAIRYRRTESNQETPQILSSHFLEIVWTVVPTVISAFVAYVGVKYYVELMKVPENAMTINVTAQKWSWGFEYENGKKTTGEFVVPVDQPVKMLLSSRDVLHSFYIPAMRVKSDAIPGRFTYVTFTPVKAGNYHVFCTEYCGTGHSDMRAQLKVVSRAEYEAWFNEKTSVQGTPAERGMQTFQEKGCNSCHPLNGTRLVGPSLLGIFGHEVEFEDGGKAIVDENYIKNSILNPASQIVKGYPNAMVSFEGQIEEGAINDLIAMIKSLDQAPEQTSEAAAVVETAKEDLSKLSPVERGQKIIQTKGCNACHSIDGSALIGPSYKGLYGRKAKLATGEEYIADDAYLKESIANPTAKVVEGFQPIMLPLGLSDEEISDVIEYIKTLK